MSTNRSPGTQKDVQPLNPFTPRGALTLLYWVFFRPSALRRHVAALAPELVRQEGWIPLSLRAWSHPRLGGFVRRAFLFALTASLLITAVAGLLATVGGGEFAWSLALACAAVGVMWGVAWDGAMGVKSGVAGDVAGGVTWGVMGGVACGVMGVAGDVAFGAASGVMGVAGDVAFDAALSITFVAAGVAWGMTEGVAGGVAEGVAESVVAGVVIGVAIGVAGGIPIPGLVSGLSTALGALRLPFYLVQLPWALGLRRADPAAALRRAPALWDEWMVLPQPGLAGLLAEAIRREPAAGLEAAARLAANPFQRWAVGRALRRVWEDDPSCLFPMLDRLLRQPPPYVAVGVSREERQRKADPYFAVKLLLGEVCGLSPIPGLSDRLARWFTAPWRAGRRGDSPVTRLVGVYYRLLTEGEWRADDLRAFEPFRGLAQGREIYRTFAALDRFLRYRRLADLPEAIEATAWMARVEAPLRPDVLAFLRRLADVGRDVRAYRHLSAAADRRDALTRAALGVRQIEREAEGVPPPERDLIAAVARRWADLIAAEQEALARPRTVRHIVSRYIVGPPLRPEHGRLFVGRDDHFRRIAAWWANPLSKPSVVVHGQRRMGKSSILYHLEQRLGSQYVTVYADLQREANVESVHGFLYNLADAIHRRVYQTLDPLPRPRPADYTREPFIPFNHFLDAVEAALGGDRWLVLMLDEFEKVEEKIRDGVFPSDLLDDLRNVMQHRPRMALVFAGCHTLEQMTREYWSPFFGAARNLKVGYLSAEAAATLITNPWDGFELNYEREAVERIIRVTGGQPFLLQTVCAALIDHVNERLRRSGAQVLPTVARDDVDAVLDGVLTAGYYFDAVWGELADHERLVLAALAEEQARPETWIPRPQVDARLRSLLDDDRLDEAWALLAARDMVDQDGPNRRFTVELVRRWVRRFRPLTKVIEQVQENKPVAHRH